MFINKYIKIYIKILLEYKKIKKKKINMMFLNKYLILLILLLINNYYK